MTKNTQYFFVIFLPFKINEFYIFERLQIFFERNNDLEFYWKDMVNLNNSE